MYPFVATAIVAALISAFGTWRVEEWRYGNKEKERIEAVLVEQQRQAKETFQKSEHVIAASNAGVVRLVALGNAADSARSALDSLRLQSAMRLQASTVSLDACTANAATLNKLFLTSGADLVRMGKVADIWANYAQTVNEAR